MMKTKEFIKRVEELGYKVVKNSLYNGEDYFSIIRPDGFRDCYVMASKPYEMSVYSEFANKKLFDLMVEYAKTPIEDREEEKEFYLKHKWIKGHAIMYLYRNELNGYCYLGENKCRPHKQRRFTLKEIEEIKEKFDTDLADFEMVEVEDEN